MTESLHGYACRQATPADLDAVADVLQQVFGGTFHAATLRHKFGGPAGNMLGSVVLTLGRQVVGFFGQIPLRAMYFGQEILAAQGTDIAILPAHRRFDLLLRLVGTSGKLLAESGVVLAYGISNAEAALAATTLAGVQPLAPVPLLVRALDASRAAPGSVARTLATRALALGWRLAEHGAHRAHPATPSSPRIARVVRFDARFDRLWDRIRADYPLALVRDAAYLNWRYADRANAGYECLCLESSTSTDVVGYGILTRVAQAGAFRGRVMELVTPRGDDRHAADPLLRAALTWFRGQAVGVVDAWMFPHAHLRGALLRHGFLPRRTGRGRFSVSLPQPDTALTAARAFQVQNWSLSVGDSDTT